MKLTFFLFTLFTCAFPYISQAQTVLVRPVRPTQQDIRSILDDPYKVIEDQSIGEMRFALPNAQKGGSSEVLYAPPAWIKRPWDMKWIYRLPTRFVEIQGIEVQGDYLVLTGRNMDQSVSQVSVFFKRKFHSQADLQLRQGPPPTARSPKLLDLAVEGCTYVDEAAKGVFVAKKLFAYGQKQEGAFDLGLLKVQQQNEAGLIVHPTGEVEVKFDNSDTPIVIGRVDPRQFPLQNNCGQVLVELLSGSQISYEHTKSPRLLLESTVLLPVLRLAQHHVVTLKFNGQEIRCEMITSNDEVVTYTMGGKLPNGQRRCDNTSRLLLDL